MLSRLLTREVDLPEPSGVALRALVDRSMRSLLAAVLTATLCAACSSSTSNPSRDAASARPSSPARLTIVSPTNGTVFRTGNVPIRIRLQDARIVPSTTTAIVPNQGHLHVYVDDQIVGMNYGLTDVLHHVTAGIHSLRVEFVGADHLPFDPRVIAQAEFEVK